MWDLRSGLPFFSQDSKSEGPKVPSPKQGIKVSQGPKNPRSKALKPRNF